MIIRDFLSIPYTLSKDDITKTKLMPALHKTCSGLYLPPLHQKKDNTFTPFYLITNQGSGNKGQSNILVSPVEKYIPLMFPGFLTFDSCWEHMILVYNVARKIIEKDNKRYGDNATFQVKDAKEKGKGLFLVGGTGVSGRKTIPDAYPIGLYKGVLWFTSSYDRYNALLMKETGGRCDADDYSIGISEFRQRDSLPNMQICPTKFNIDPNAKNINPDMMLEKVDIKVSNVGQCMMINAPSKREEGNVTSYPLGYLLRASGVSTDSNKVDKKKSELNTSHPNLEVLLKAFWAYTETIGCVPNGFRNPLNQAFVMLFISCMEIKKDDEILFYYSHSEDVESESYQGKNCQLRGLSPNISTNYRPPIKEKKKVEKVVKKSKKWAEADQAQKNAEEAARIAVARHKELEKLHREREQAKAKARVDAARKEARETQRKRDETRDAALGVAIDDIFGGGEVYESSPKRQKRSDTPPKRVATPFDIINNQEASNLVSEAIAPMSTWQHFANMSGSPITHQEIDDLLDEEF